MHVLLTFKSNRYSSQQPEPLVGMNVSNVYQNIDLEPRFAMYRITKLHDLYKEKALIQWRK